MGKKLTRLGMELRRSVRAEIDTNPTVDRKIIRSKFKVQDALIESSMLKTVAEWDVLMGELDQLNASLEKAAKQSLTPSTNPTGVRKYIEEKSASPQMPGLEQGIVKFMRKPAKMGEDFIFWIPRVYLKNGLVDPKTEYEVYLKKR